MKPTNTTPLTTPSPQPVKPPVQQASTPQTTGPTKEQEARNDRYASALARMTALDYEMQDKHQPETKHFIKKSWIIYTVISLIISIIGLIIADFAFKKNPSTSGSNGQDTINQLLDTTKEVRSAENQ